MYRLVAVPLLALAALLPYLASSLAQPKKPEQNKFALLIGVNKYKHVAMNGEPPLEYAEADVTELAEVLKANDYEVVLLTGKDATREKILAAYKDVVKKGDVDGAVVVAVAGHGIQFEKEDEAYYCPYDTDMQAAKRDGKPILDRQAKPILEPVPDTCIKLTELLSGFHLCPAGNRIFLVDCCRNDPTRVPGGASNIGSFLNNLSLPDKRTAALFSCAAGQVSYEDKRWKHGAFFYHLLQGLKAGTGSVLKLTAYLEESVPNTVKELPGAPVQTPYLLIPPLKLDFCLKVAPSQAKSEEKTELYPWKAESRKRVVRTLKCGTTTMEFVKVPKGSFTMGSDMAKDREASDHESPVHKVTFTKDLWVAKYPVTKDQFAAFVSAKSYQSEAEADGKGGFGFNGKLVYASGANYTWKETGWEQSGRHPVVNVTWNDAAAFCDWMSGENKLKSGFARKDGKWDLTDYKKPVGVRMLTEAEYEYANRGGEKSIYITGDKVESLEGYLNIADKSAKAKWECSWAVGFDDGEPFTSPVGKYKPNGFGLYDMTGNVWSWCADCYDAKLYGRGDVTDPGVDSHDKHKHRMLRGGSWINFPWIYRAAYRNYYAPAYRKCDVGFRVCVERD